MIATNRNAVVPPMPSGDDALDEVEAALFRREALVQTFLEQSPMGVAHLDAAGVVTFENHRLRTITGEDPEAAWIGRPLGAIDGLDAGLPGLVNRMLAGGEPLAETEVAFVRSDGARRALRLHGAPIQHPEDGTVGGVLMVSDVTAEVARAETLRLLARYDEAEPFLHYAAIAQPPAGFLSEAARILGETARADRAVVLFLDAERYTERTRWSGPDVPAAPPLVLDAAALSEDSRPVHLAGRQTQRLAELVGATEVVALPLDAEGDRAGLLLLLREGEGTVPWTGTERRALARLGSLAETLWAWLRAEARYRQVVASIEDTLFSFSLDDEGERSYAFLSEQVESLTGHPAATLTAGTIPWRAGLVLRDDRAAVERHDRTLSEGRDSRLVYRIERADGQVRWLRESASPHRERTGLVAGILSDVTEARETEAALARTREDAASAHRVKSSFVSMMSHEIRTPLGAIRGYAEVLLEEVAALDTPAPEITEFAATIHEQAGTVLALINDIFELANLQSGRVLVERSPVPLHPILEAFAHRQTPLLAERGLNLVLGLDPGEPVVLGEAARITEILEQLVSNAVKFTDAGHVRIATELHPGGVRLRVEDTGIGIEPGYLGEMFEPFSQGDNRLNRDFGGSGLGLALVARLAEAMNGTATAESTPGEGTAVEIVLPRADL